MKALKSSGNLITTEEALFDFLWEASRKQKKSRKNRKSLTFLDTTQFDRLVSPVERSEAEIDAYFDEAVLRAPFGSTSDDMPIEQWLLMRYGRADDLIAAYLIVMYLSELSAPNALLLDLREGRIFVESTETFEQMFDVKVRLRLLH